MAIKVMIPSNMTQRQKVLLKEFAQEERKSRKGLREYKSVDRKGKGSRGFPCVFASKESNLR